MSGQAIATPTAFSVGEEEGPERVWGELVSGNYFAVLGVKPILGCEVYVAPGDRTVKTPGKGENYYHMLLLAKDEVGYKNLVKLVSRGYL